MAIAEDVLKFHRRLVADPHHRFRLWEHCYAYFQRGQNDCDLASLHLAFYLASWGMYRGSSGRLHKLQAFAEGALISRPHRCLTRSRRHLIRRPRISARNVADAWLSRAQTIA